MVGVAARARARARRACCVGRHVSIVASDGQVRAASLTRLACKGVGMCGRLSEGHSQRGIYERGASAYTSDDAAVLCASTSSAYAPSDGYCGLQLYRWSVTCVPTYSMELYLHCRCALAALEDSCIHSGVWLERPAEERGARSERTPVQLGWCFCPGCHVLSTPVDHCARRLEAVCNRFAQCTRTTVHGLRVSFCIGYRYSRAYMTMLLICYFRYAIEY